MLELLDTTPDIQVNDVEYRRLLGYPRDHEPGERALELAAWTRTWFSRHGRPWIYLREVGLKLADDSLLIDGVEFHSDKLHDHLRAVNAQRAMLVAVSAGADLEEHARQLWEDARPDEYFFLEIFGSAVVEHLVAATSGRICDLAERDGLMAAPHYSPGYVGWDIEDQTKLFELITAKMTHSLPEPIGVLSSGMLRPKKSLLAVFGLTARPDRATDLARLIPCESCSYAPCRYRRAPYTHAPAQVGGLHLAASRTINGFAARPAPVSPLTANAKYTINPRALDKWAKERVRLSIHDDRTVHAIFRFDGTTCSNMGQPLAFEYEVNLSGPEQRYTILDSECRPASGDVGHTKMCAYLEDATDLMSAITDEKPLLGRPLDDVIDWERRTRSSGCYCDRDSRLHKWGLALEVIHYALARATPSTSNSAVHASAPSTFSNNS